MVPELSTVINSVEELSRDFFYKNPYKETLFNGTARVMVAYENPLIHVYSSVF